MFVLYLFVSIVFFFGRIQFTKSEFQSNLIPPPPHHYLNNTFHPQKDPIEININPTMLRKATINYGSLTYETKRKIINNECLNIIVVGGSVSCFHFAPVSFSH